MKILFGILLFLIPFAVLSWAIATNKSNKQLVKYTLISALIFGIILQSLFESHAHVPGSGAILLAVEIISSSVLLALYFGFNYLYKKFNHMKKDKP